MTDGIPLPTDHEIGLVHAAGVHAAHNWNDARMFAGSGELFFPAAMLATVVFKVHGVDDRLRELIALRVAALMHSEFAWTANVRMGQNAGVTQEEIDLVGDVGSAPRIDDEADLILTAVDEVTRDGTTSDDTLAKLRHRYDDVLCRKYLFVMSYFNFFARFVNSTRVPIETPEALDSKVGDRTSPV